MEEPMANGQVDRVVVTHGPATDTGQDLMEAEDRLVTRRGARQLSGASLRRPLFSLFRGMVALALLVPVSIIAAGPVAADHTIGAATTCNNSVGAGGGQGVICEITIVNTTTPSGGSAVVTIHECIGSAGAPLSGVCSTTTQSLSAPVTSVNQCNYTVVGGGATLHCSVVITNNFTGGVAPGATAATVNQCVGSGGPGNVLFACDPFPATTDGAAIIQCNGTATGGGASLTCTASGTMATALAVTINQCNNSAGGAGSLVVCTASITSSAIAAGTTVPPTSTASEGSSPTSTPPLAVLIFALAGLLLATVVVQRRTVRS
jgi:hypothetical protein